MSLLFAPSKRRQARASRLNRAYNTRVVVTAVTALVYQGIYACALLRLLLSVYTYLYNDRCYILCYRYILRYYNYYTSPPFTLLIPAARRRPQKTVPITVRVITIIIIYFESQFVFGLVSILYYNTRAAVNPPHAPPPSHRRYTLTYMCIV